MRSLRALYEGGLISKRKYTSIRNSSDVVGETEKKKKNMKTEFMTGCEVPTILSYKTLMCFVRSMEIGEVLSLDNLPSKYSMESTSGVYRPLKPFLLRLADLFLFLDSKTPCLHWFNGEKGVLHVAIGAGGAPFGKDDTATGKLLSSDTTIDRYCITNLVVRQDDVTQLLNSENHQHPKCFRNADCAVTYYMNSQDMQANLKITTNYCCCLRFSFLTPDWLYPNCNTITLHKYFW